MRTMYVSTSRILGADVRESLGTGNRGEGLGLDAELVHAHRIDPICPPRFPVMARGLERRDEADVRDLVIAVALEDSA